jgi:hypothetical protein
MKPLVDKHFATASSWGEGANRAPIRTPHQKYATSKRVSEGALADALGYEKLVAQPLTQFIASFYIHGNAFDRHVATSYELLYP